MISESDGFEFKVPVTYIPLHVIIHVYRNPYSGVHIAQISKDGARRAHSRKNIET
jgi:hypothetical protein